MKKEMKLSKEFIDIIGKEWDGKYTFLQLNSLEYISIADEVIGQLREEGKNVFLIPEIYRNERLVYKAILLNGEPIPHGTMPSKLLELLLPEVLKMNAITLEEKQEIFLLPWTEQKKKRNKN